MENPWDIQSIYELQYFNCPSCSFKDQSKQEFINHAYISHSNCVFYLSKISDNSFSDVLCPWGEELKTEIKKEDFDELGKSFISKIIFSSYILTITIICFYIFH